MRNAAGKVMWVGRATVFMVGLAVILALVLGVATTALGATGASFILGKPNSATTPTSLVSTLSKVTQSALSVTNKSGGPALDLRVGNTTTPANSVAPMKVNSNKMVTNLNADQLDGKSEEDFYATGSKVADSAHADQADNATNAENAANADTVDGKHAADFYAAGSKVADSSHADEADVAATATEADRARVAREADHAKHADSAQRADSATNADKAKSADAAALAQNANKLDGKDSTAFAAAYKRTVVVSPTGTDTENGQALLDVLSGITDASATKKYLLYVEPGIYDLGVQALQMRPFVDIEGSGQRTTKITSAIPGVNGCSTGTVRGADNAELRFLTVENTASASSLCDIAIYNPSGSPSFTFVSAMSTTQGESNIGVYNSSTSSPTMTNVTATATGATHNTGVANLNSASLTIKHSTLSSLTQQSNGIAKVADTQILGSVERNVGTLQCFNNYNENLAAVTCP